MLRITGGREKQIMKMSCHKANLPYLLASGFLLFLIFHAWLGYSRWKMAGFYLVVSLLTFLVYTADKHAARNQRWRTAESTLQLLALFGGWPGALVAQRRLRHKSSKTAFLTVFWFAVLGNLLGLYWLCFSASASNFRKILGLS
ncbi:MAG: DUF1294 domain-containing protein [Gammaproteobacteria bacterium]|nr:DUF1294 domain-containing protein [Gammaproteobacteria bacterium]MBU2181018.1 DUF1294 domain-containing protein [Gammaproteobacteria bacterium]MBU2223508.1 DUF1294 domain-containing protein [Gammaproteobacteria bacterium]